MQKVSKNDICQVFIPRSVTKRNLSIIEVLLAFTIQARNKNYNELFINLT